VAPTISGIIVYFKFHIRCISISKLIYFNLLWWLLLLTAMSCHSVAVVLTLVQTKQIIFIHKRNNTKNAVQTTHNTVNTYNYKTS
jgi:hypothetical protein